MDPFLQAGLNISKKYVINLDHRTDRKESAINELNRIGVTDFKIFPGIYTRQTGVVAQRLPNPGTTGCFLSHQFLFHEAIANDYESILIMEDDLKFDKDFITKFPQLWKDVPADRDLVWIGCGQTRPGEKITENIYRDSTVWGAQCYLIFRSGIQKIYNQLNHNPMTVHVDVTINRVPNLVQYNFHPSLVTQHPLGTDNVTVADGAFAKFNSKFTNAKTRQPQRIL